MPGILGRVGKLMDEAFCIDSPTSILPVLLRAKCLQEAIILQIKGYP